MPSYWYGATYVPMTEKNGNHLLFFAVKTLLISTKATCLTPKSASRASFSLAGFG